MECKQASCKGKVIGGICQTCGDQSCKDEKSQEPLTESSSIDGKSSQLREGLSASKSELLAQSSALAKTVADDFESWRMQADLLVSAIAQLEVRQIQPDESVTLLGVPLRETALREAAENALRNCAHFAQTFGERVNLIDEANRIRATTWF